MMVGYVLLFVAALMASIMLTPCIRVVAIRFGIIDKPEARRVHLRPTPKMGGVAIWAGFVVSVLLFGEVRGPVAGLILGSTLMLIVGMADDVLNLRPWQKLLGQVVASLVLVAFGGRIEFITNPFGGMIYLSDFSIPLTILWIVAITNVLNFIDGVDGLAAGVSAIASATVFGVSVLNGQPFVAPLSAALAGSAIGFLRYNVNPACIFMGDAGALFLGYTISGIGVIGAVKGPTTLALAISAVALTLPILDTAFVIVERVRNHQPVYSADKRHLHHRLLDLGLTQRQVVARIYAVSLILGLGALILARTPAVMVAGSILLGVLVLWYTAMRGHSGRRYQGHRH